MGFVKNDEDKEYVCRICMLFLDAEQLEEGSCPECGSDEGVFNNDLNKWI